MLLKYTFCCCVVMVIVSSNLLAMAPKSRLIEKLRQSYMESISKEFQENRQAITSTVKEYSCWLEASIKDKSLEAKKQFLDTELERIENALNLIDPVVAVLDEDDLFFADSKTTDDWVDKILELMSKNNDPIIEILQRIKTKCTDTYKGLAGRPVCPVRFCFLGLEW